MRLLLLLLPLLAGLAVASAQAEDEELLENPGFESPLDGEDWFCFGSCVLERTSEDAHTGNYSGYVRDREGQVHGAAQWTTRLVQGAKYVFRAYIRILNLHEDAMYHEGRFIFRLEFSDGTSEQFTIGRSLYLRPDRGWQRVGGDFETPEDKELVRARFHMNIQDTPEVDYLIDTASLRRIPHDPDWRQAAQATIERIRRGRINVTVETAPECSDVEVKVDMVRASFPFGTCVKAPLIAGEDIDADYRDVFYENFNYAVLENALKWRLMEWTRGNINFERPDLALDELESRNMPVRGHAVFWDREKNNPEWLVTGGYEGEEMRAELQRRVDYLIPHYRGRLTHWDVNNELINGDWYEQEVGDPDLTAWMFRAVRDQDPDVELFLNDYGVLRDTIWNVAYADHARLLLSHDVPLTGLGLQTHVMGAPDIDRFRVRLAEVAALGLPLWVTELDISELAPVETRADAMDDLLTLLYSTEQVAGILLWGFWDGAMSKPDAALFEGPDFTPNAVGLRWQELTRSRWSTHATLTPASPGTTESWSVPAYHGQYEVTAWRAGAEAAPAQTVSVTPGEENAQVTVTVTGCEN